MTDRVIVTGASGFVGRHVVSDLLRRGYEVHVIARSPSAHAAPGVVQHRADLLDQAATARIVADVQATHLAHLAWFVTPGLFWRAPENLDWVGASLALYRAFARAGGTRMLAVGTCAEYDWAHDTLGEATPCRPSTLYGTTKLALFHILQAAALQDGVGLAWARLFFLYGPHEQQARLVPDVALSILADRPVLCGDGIAQRDFMHVEDCARALAGVLGSSHVGAINVASGTCVPLAEVIAAVAERLGRADLVRLGARPTPPGEPARLAADVTRLRQILGSGVARPLHDGLAATADWWRERQAVLQPVPC